MLQSIWCSWNIVSAMLHVNNEKTNDPKNILILCYVLCAIVYIIYFGSLSACCTLVFASFFFFFSFYYWHKLIYCCQANGKLPVSAKIKRHEKCKLCKRTMWPRKKQTLLLFLWLSARYTDGLLLCYQTIFCDTNDTQYLRSNNENICRTMAMNRN